MNAATHTLVGSLSFLSSTHCRAACSSRENPGSVSSTATAAEEEDDATDDLELMGLDRNARRSDDERG